MSLISKVINHSVSKVVKTAPKSVKNAAEEMSKATFKKELKALAQQYRQEIGVGYFAYPPPKKYIKNKSLKDELANFKNMSEYLKANFLLLKKKGYNIAKQIGISDDVIPRETNLGGVCGGRWIAFGSDKLGASSPLLIFHENGHYIHGKKAPMPLLNFLSVFPHLSKKNKAIYIKDIQRAYDQKYYVGNLNWEDFVSRGWFTNREVKTNKKNIAQKLAKNGCSNINEFVADCFALKIRGFEFSPEIETLYKKYKGPEVKGIVSDEEYKQLLALRKKLLKSA